MNHDPQHNMIIIEGRATYERIQADLHEMDEDEAIRVIRDFSKIYPDFAQAHNDLGVLYYQCGNSLKSLAHYEKAHKLDPSSVTYRKNLADFYFVELEWADEAIQTYRSILEDNPFDIETLNALGTISQQSGRKKQARGYFERTLQIDSINSAAREALLQLGGPVPAQTRQTQLPHFEPRPSTAVSSGSGISAAPLKSQTPSAATPEQLYSQALALANAGNTREACRKLEDIVECHPKYAVAHNDLGVLYQQDGDLSRSRRHHEEAVRLQPDNTILMKNLADLLFIGLGEIEAALKVYIRLLQIAPRDVEVLKALATVCMETGKLDDARSFTQSILSIEPWNKDAREFLPLIDEAGRKQGSAAAVNRSADELYAEAVQLVREDRLIEAHPLFEQLVHHNPEYALGHNDLAVVRYRVGDLEGARRAYERAVQLQPGNATFRKNLADLYFTQLGRTDDAIRIYLELFREQPRDLETLIALGQISATIGRPEEAKSFYRRALEIEPWNASVREALLGL